MSNLIEHAKAEFKAAGYKPAHLEEGGPNKWIQENILELLTIFSKQGHSGMSASYCISLFAKLANFEPLTPLTGEDDEWEKVGQGCFQNKRCSRVFKDLTDGKEQAYDLYGKVFVSAGGSTYTNSKSRVTVTFPYIPTTQYVYETHARH